MATDIGFLATGLAPVKEAFGLEFGTGNIFVLPCVTSSIAVAVSAVRKRKKRVGNAPSKNDVLAKSRMSRSDGSPGQVAGTGSKVRADASQPFSFHFQFVLNC